MSLPCGSPSRWPPGVTLTLRDVTLVRALVFTYGNTGFVNLQPAIFHMREGSRLLLQNVVLQTLCSTVTYYSQQDFSDSVQVVSPSRFCTWQSAACTCEPVVLSRPTATVLCQFPHPCPTGVPFTAPAHIPSSPIYHADRSHLTLPNLHHPHG